MLAFCLAVKLLPGCERSPASEEQMIPATDSKIMEPPSCIRLTIQFLGWRPGKDA